MGSEGTVRPWVFFKQTLLVNMRIISTVAPGEVGTTGLVMEGAVIVETGLTAGEITWELKLDQTIKQCGISYALNNKACYGKARTKYRTARFFGRVSTFPVAERLVAHPPA